MRRDDVIAKLKETEPVNVPCPAAARHLRTEADINVPTAPLNPSSTTPKRGVVAHGSSELALIISDAEPTLVNGLETHCSDAGLLAFGGMTMAPALGR